MVIFDIKLINLTKHHRQIACYTCTNHYEFVMLVCYVHLKGSFTKQSHIFNSYEVWYS